MSASAAFVLSQRALPLLFPRMHRVAVNARQAVMQVAIQVFAGTSAGTTWAAGQVMDQARAAALDYTQPLGVDLRMRPLGPAVRLAQELLATTSQLEQWADAWLRRFAPEAARMAERVQAMAADAIAHAQEAARIAGRAAAAAAARAQKAARVAAGNGISALGSDLAILGLAQLPATAADLRAAWVVAIRRCHPDLGGSATVATAVNAAYARLRMRPTKMRGFRCRS